MLVMNTMWPFLSNGGMPQVLWALMGLVLPVRRPSGTDAGALWRTHPTTVPDRVALPPLAARSAP